MKAVGHNVEDEEKAREKEQVGKERAID